MDKRTKSIYQRTGFFVSFAVVVLILFILFIAQQQRVFAKKYSYYTIFTDAIGISKTTPIYFKGYEIGRIRSFAFTNDTNIEVQFHIFEEFRKLIVEESAISKTIHPLSGRANIDFLMGPSNNSLVEEFGLIASLDMEEGKKLLADRKVRTRGDQISALLANLGSFVENLNRDDNYDQGSVFRALYHIAYVAENLNTGLVNMNNLLVSLQRDDDESDGVLFRFMVNLADFTEELRETNEILASNLADMNTVIKNFQQTDGLLTTLIDPTEENIIKPLNNSLEMLFENMKNINEVISFINNQSPEMALLMYETKKTLEDLQKTLEGVNNNPLIKGGIMQQEIPSSGERIRIMDVEQ